MRMRATSSFSFLAFLPRASSWRLRRARAAAARSLALSDSPFTASSPPFSNDAFTTSSAFAVSEHSHSPDCPFPSDRLPTDPISDTRARSVGYEATDEADADPLRLPFFQWRRVRWAIQGPKPTANLHVNCARYGRATPRSHQGDGPAVVVLDVWDSGLGKCTHSGIISLRQSRH